MKLVLLGWAVCGCTAGPLCESDPERSERPVTLSQLLDFGGIPLAVTGDVYARLARVEDDLSLTLVGRVPGYLIGEAGGELFAFEWMSPRGVLRASADLGRSWEVRSSFDVDTRVVSARDRLYAVSVDTYLHVSMDGGRTWSPRASRAMPGFGEVLAADGELVWVRPSGSDVRVQESRDGGVTFHPLSVPATQLMRPLPGLLFARQELGTWRSLDDGLTWADYGPIWPSVGQGGALFAVHDGELRTSTDRGETWPAIDVGLGTVYGVDSAPGVLLVFAQEGTRLRATDGTTTEPRALRPIWESSGGIWAGIDGALYVSTTRELETPALLQTAESVLARSTDGGATYTPLSAIVPTIRVSLVLDANHYLAIRNPGGATVYTDDGGTTYRDVPLPIDLHTPSLISDARGGIYGWGWRARALVLFRLDDLGATFVDLGEIPVPYGYNVQVDREGRVIAVSGYNADGTGDVVARWDGSRWSTAPVAGCESVIDFALRDDGITLHCWNAGSRPSLVFLDAALRVTGRAPHPGDGYQHMVGLGTETLVQHRGVLSAVAPDGSLTERFDLSASLSELVGFARTAEGLAYVGHRERCEGTNLVVTGAIE